MAVRVRNRRGKEVTLLNPAEKGRKYSAELKYGIHATNDGVVKCDEKGNPITLTSEQRAYRSGYLDSRKDNAKCYNAKIGKKNKKKSRGNNYPAVF